ncbi:U3 small nucleolar RNA-associated protein 6 -like protein [Collichthys lucidus]|uniref:U3 small nucleolar RNA-associated protein 6-like protein n=1 Tax=Collichthys lucidus TaxID=240159 RepID=A0A4U5U3I6_COLLU|nr:U3 small nucleolar RNA-associated protein 6 -like protein [Collichthys lucidus]
MAEIVQQRIEERIPELEQLERVGLFTKKEVRSIIKRVTALEYKLHRLMHIAYQFKREEIEYPVIHRINSVFRRATNKWKVCVRTLWIMAAKSELEDRSSSESARHLFLRALRFHPNNKKVYQEFSAEILSGKLAEVVYRDATGKITEAEFVISLLNIAAIFDFTQELQDLVLQDLQANYTGDSLTWDFMARRELEAPGAGEELQTAKGRASDISRREERCCQVYEEGVKSLNSEPMWTCYVGFCLERLKRKTNVQELKDKRQERLLGVLQRAHDSSQLKEDYYKNWRESPLWQLQVQWSAANQSPEETEAVFKRGLLSAVTAVSTEMKESYLDWSYSTGGYKKARKTFTSLQENRPLTKAFFTTMIQIEKEQETPKMNRLRDYYERALQEFGTSDDDLWLQYIQEELGPLGQPENCGKVHWRAMKFLEGESVERFITKYTLLQTGHL